MTTKAAVLVSFAVGVAAGAVLGGSLLGLRFAGGKLPAAMCEAVVRISLDANGRPKVTPEDACLAMDRELTWDIAPELMAGEVKIEFVDEGNGPGPFPEDQANNPHNKGEGKYLRDKADNRPIRSNPAKKLRRWPYTVTYTAITSGGAKPVTIDPAVCVRD